MFGILQGMQNKNPYLSNNPLNRNYIEQLQYWKMNIEHSYHQGTLYIYSGLDNIQSCTEYIYS